MAHMKEEVKSLIEIQKNIRLFLSKVKLQKLLTNTRLLVKVHGKIIYTLKRCLNAKTTITIENIETRDHETKETFLDISSFNLIDVIRDKLNAIPTCKEKVRILTKFARGKIFITKLRNHFRESSQLTDFQESFRNRIVFAKIYPVFLY